jgi:hypothetical protein
MAVAALATGVAICSCGASAPGVRSAPSPPAETQLDPSAFAAGACEAFEPTKGDVSRTKATTVVRLSAADESGGVLTLQGSHDDVVARDECANDANARALVGIYFDAGATAQNAGSLTAYDAARPFATENLTLATLVQTDVLADLNAQGWGIPDDGVMPDTTLGSYVGDPSAGGIAGEAASYNHLLLLGPASPGFFSTPSQMPGTVIEPLYLTDPFEGTIADSSQGQKAIAQGIATAIEKFLAPAPRAHNKSK